jgi:peptidoglycan hydrolase-like protein with peptidoglycan-binding domain
MKSILPLLTVLLLGATAVRADDQTRNVQSQLKNQGFFYGDVDGKPSSELSAAIRRYQIRNGLEVTGELDKGTIAALGLGGAPAKSEPAQQTPPAIERSQPNADLPPVPKPKSPAPPINIRRDNDENGGGSPPPPEEPMPRPPHGPGIVPPPAPLDDRNPVAPGPGAGPYSRIFIGTPYASAPRVVQESTLRRAQQILGDRGFYHDAVTGQPSPALEEAILTYQRSARLPLSGKLDLQTLAVLRLLPNGRGPGNPPLKPFNPQAGGPDPASHPVYRGVWVQ